MRPAVPDKHCYYLVEVGVKPAPIVIPLSGATTHGTLSSHVVRGIPHPEDTVNATIVLLPITVGTAPPPSGSGPKTLPAFPYPRIVDLH